MVVIPAVCIKDAQCVRMLPFSEQSVSKQVVSEPSSSEQFTSEHSILEQSTSGQSISGKTVAARAEHLSDDPEDMTGRWMDRGARRVHMVDVDAALGHEANNRELICRVLQRFPNFEIQVSGGIRSLDDIEQYVKAGANSVALSTKALSDEGFLDEACQEFAGKILVNLDVLDSAVYINGRRATTQMPVSEHLSKLEDYGVSAVIYNDLAREGRLNGASIESLIRLTRRSSIPVIASGGIADLEDIEILADHASKGICGAIIGRGLYDGRFTVKDAQRVCDAAISE